MPKLVQSWPTDAPMELGSTGLWAVYAPVPARPNMSGWYVAADEQDVTDARDARLARQAAHNSEEAVAQRKQKHAEQRSANNKKKQQAELDRLEKRRQADKRRRKAAKRQRTPEAASQELEPAAKPTPRKTKSRGDINLLMRYRV